jgi:hydrogenase maturation protease
MPENSTLVLGVGNPFRRDDGIGPAVIARLQSDEGLKGVDVLDGGIDGLALMDYMQGYQKVLIVDAVNMGAHPGEFRLFSPQEAALSITADALSTHGFGVAELIALMNKLDMQVDMRILGIQAKDVTFGEGFSPEISARLDDILELVKKEVTKVN